ncbi:hypothetical protein HMPREF1436_00089 [Helicobacter pylori GAMchJs136i]|nr:hypothetical protein HMPREF1436_00089 [Helicobacter pylori GAMchJs136i]
MFFKFGIVSIKNLRVKKERSLKIKLLKGIGGILKSFPLQPLAKNPLTQKECFFNHLG